MMPYWLMFIYYVVYFAIAAIFIVSLWKIYEKAGQAGWKCLIPVYNEIVMLRFTGRPVWWIFMILPFYIFLGFSYYLLFSGNFEHILFKVISILFFISSILILIYGIRMYHGLSKVFGQSAGFTVGLVLLPFIFFPVLAFGGFSYMPPVGKKPETTELLKPVEAEL